MYPTLAEERRRTGASIVNGIVLCDQVKTLDLDARNAAFIERLPDELLREILDTIIGTVERLSE